MRIATVLVIFFLSVSLAIAQQPEKKKLTQRAEQMNLEMTMQVEQSQDKRQEYVQVSKEAYRGLDVQIESVDQQLSNYHPRKELLVPTDPMRLYRPMDYEMGIGARPYKSGRLIEVKVPQ